MSRFLPAALAGSSLIRRMPGAPLRVLVDGELCLEYTDPRPFLQGMIGVRTHQCAAAFENLTVEPISE